MNISAMNNMSGQIWMTLNVITETDTRINESIPAMAACPSTFHGP